MSCETIRLWCINFGSKCAKRLKRKHQGHGDTFYIDEVFVKIGGTQHYLWRAVEPVDGSGATLASRPLVPVTTAATGGTT